MLPMTGQLVGQPGINNVLFSIIRVPILWRGFSRLRLFLYATNFFAARTRLIITEPAGNRVVTLLVFFCTNWSTFL